MDDLAALSDITGPAVLNTLLERFKHGQYYTYCGDILLAVNPCHQTSENESEVGQMYRKSKPLQELPPHVVAIAHRAYRMLVNDVMPQAIVIMGRPGSGKTEASRRIISQLLREARLSPKSGLGPRIIMAQHILATLMTARTLDNPDSTRGIKMATLNFRSDGQMVSAEFQGVCVDKWYLTDRRAGCGVFTIFYAMMAGMSDHQRRLYSLSDIHGSFIDRLLNRNDSRPLFLDREDHHRHVQMFDFFSHCLQNSGIDQTTQNYAGIELSAILAVLSAILHLGNIDVIINPQIGRLTIANPHELASVCDLLALGQDYMEAEIMSTSSVVRGEVVRVACTQEQALWNRDVLVVEMYRRLLAVITARLNHALTPDTHYVDHGPLTPITVVDGLAPEHSNQVSTGGLEAFFRNMAAERLQHHLHDVIFRRDVEVCERERVPAYKIKFADNSDIVSAVFAPDYGIMNKLTSVTLDPNGSPDKLVSLMDGDRSLKKNGSYVHAGKAVKSSEVFFLKHTGLGQVTYTARDFISKNRTFLPESSRQMLQRSANPVVPVIANVPLHESGFLPDVVSPDAYFANRAFQSDMTFLTQSLDSANLHYIRCVKASANLTAGQWDGQLVTEQLKESCVVEVARQRKFGFSSVVSQDLFVRSYRDIALSQTATHKTVSDVCKAILQNTGLQSRGVTLTKNSVFLRYWHVLRLHALRANHTRNIVTAQAQVRGFLARRRYQRMLRSLGVRPGMRQPALPPRPGQQTYPQDNGYPRSPTSPMGDNISNSSGPGYPADYERLDTETVADDPTGLYTTIVDKVLASLHTLDPSTWAKAIYLERERQVVKVYLEERSIIIDGSRGDFDGSRLGLGVCRNPQRDEESAVIKSHVIEGVRLKHDTDDSISACRLCELPVIVKGLGQLVSGSGSAPDSLCLSEDVLLNRGQLPLEKTIKIFDMKEFRSKIALDIKERRFSKAKMRRACVLGLAFGRDDADDIQTPCWLCIVNVRALQALESESLIMKAQIYTAELQMTSPQTEEEKLRAEEAKRRHNRERWARVDQREHLQAKEEGHRHVRHRLRSKGLPVGEHVGYSWNNDTGGEKTTMQHLQDWIDPEMSKNARRSSGSGHKQGRDWAKAETVIRDQKSRAMTRSVSTVSSGGDFY